MAWHQTGNKPLPEMMIQPTNAYIDGLVQDCSISNVLAIDLINKSQNTPVPYPTMYHFVTEMCTCVHISVTEWCIVGCLANALWDLWEGSIHREMTPTSLSGPRFHASLHIFPPPPGPAGSPSRTPGGGGTRWRHLM